MAPPGLLISNQNINATNIMIDSPSMQTIISEPKKMEKNSMSLEMKREERNLAPVINVHSPTSNVKNLLKNSNIALT
jgi:hypothetical protein